MDYKQKNMVFMQTGNILILKEAIVVCHTMQKWKSQGILKEILKEISCLLSIQ